MSDSLVDLELGRIDSLYFSAGLLGARAAVEIGRKAEQLTRAELGHGDRESLGQQLRALRLRDREPLRFWTAESSRANAKVDFIVGDVPVEVKAGADGTLRSMHQFLARGGGRLGIRLDAGPPRDRQHRVRIPGFGEIDYRLVSLPAGGVYEFQIDVSTESVSWMAVANETGVSELAGAVSFIDNGEAKRYRAQFLTPGRRGTTTTLRLPAITVLESGGEVLLNNFKLLRIKG